MFWVLMGILLVFGVMAATWIAYESGQVLPPRRK